MSSLHTIVIESEKAAASFKGIVNKAGKRDCINGLIDFLSGSVAGAYSSAIDLYMGAVQASGTITFTGLPVADETVTIGGIDFTAKASGATGNQFNIGASATLTAAALAAAINASTTAGIAGVVTATSALGVVTVTCIIPGRVGNGITLAEALTNATVSGARLASGADGTSLSHSLGVA